MFRLLRDAVAARRRDRPKEEAQDLGRAVREPDPYVWRLPTPHDARWRRWHKRCRAAGRYLPFPQGEAQLAPVPPLSWSADDNVVRPYVLRP